MIMKIALMTFMTMRAPAALIMVSLTVAPRMPLWAIAGTAMVMAEMHLAAVLLPLGLALLAPLLVEFQTVLVDIVPPRSGVPPIKKSCSEY
jgi:hypothetical protein